MDNHDINPGDDPWNAFELGLGPEHQAFIVRLAMLFLQLKGRETRVCLLIKIGLNTHEIATLLHLSERSIECCRRVIRRKLALESGIRIRTVLESIDPIEPDR